MVDRGEKPLQRLNVFFFYELGEALAKLKQAIDVDPLPTKSDLYLPLILAQRQMSLLAEAEVLSLQVADAAIQKLKSIVDGEVQATQVSFSNYKPGEEVSKLDYPTKYFLNTAIDEFRTVFSAELGTSDAYIVSKKGIYSTKDLIERTENALSASLRVFLPPQAITDFKEAGRCLAYDLFTASGFHVLRATDATLRAYYSRFVGVAPKPKARNWGAYTKILRKCAEDKSRALRPDLKNLNLIDQIRDLHRNPLIHPEDNLDEDKAVVLFDVCKSAIIAMADEIKTVGDVTIASAPARANS